MKVQVCEPPKVGEGCNDDDKISGAGNQKILEKALS